MDRREFLLSLSATVPVVAWPLEAPHGDDWRSFEITTSVRIANPSDRTRLWLPLPWKERSEYQRVLGTRWDAPGAARAGIVAAPGYDVTLLCVEWATRESVGPVTLVDRVSTRDRRVDLVAAGKRASGRPGQRAALEQWLRPTSLLQTDGIVRETAESIVGGYDGTIARARAIYEWVVDHTTRDPTTPGCGLGDVASMLKSGYLGGKCADINALFVALARSVGIPARDAYGIRVADSRLGFRSLGRSGDISKAQHCRAEFHAAGFGWVPVDPADVRKVVLEEVAGGLPMDDPKVGAARSALFGSWEMNWVTYNHGHDVALPGSDRPALPFLMYPVAEAADGRLDSLDPQAFSYRIESKEIAA